MNYTSNGASAQNQEIINEQAIAQVSNKLNSEDMSDIENISATASGVMPVPASDSRNETNTTTNNNINNSNNITIMNTTSNNNSVIANISELIANGYEFCFIRGNQQRDLKKSHIDTLIESLKRCGNTILTPIEVIPAEQASHDGLSLERLSVDEKGKFSFTPIAGGECIDKMLTVVDGQHRFAAYLKATKIDKIMVNVEVRTLSLGSMSVANFLAEKNFCQLAWCHKDMANATNAKFAGKGETLMSIVQEWVNEYGLSQREAFKILSFKDSYKRKLYSESFNSDNLDKTLVGNPKQIERGKKIFEAFRHGFVGQANSLKNSEAIDTVIAVYEAADDTEKASVVDELILFFTTIKDKLDMDNPFKKDTYLEMWEEFKAEIADPTKLAEYQAKAAEIMSTDGILSKTENTRRNQSDVKKAIKAKKDASDKVARAESALKTAKKQEAEAKAKLDELNASYSPIEVVDSSSANQGDDKTNKAA